MVRRYKDVEAMKESLRKEMIRLGLQKKQVKLSITSVTIKKLLQAHRVFLEELI